MLLIEPEEPSNPSTLDSSKMYAVLFASCIALFGLIAHANPKRAH